VCLECRSTKLTSSIKKNCCFFRQRIVEKNNTDFYLIDDDNIILLIYLNNVMVVKYIVMCLNAACYLSPYQNVRCTLVFRFRAMIVLILQHFCLSFFFKCVIIMVVTSKNAWIFNFNIFSSKESEYYSRNFGRTEIKR